MGMTRPLARVTLSMEVREAQVKNAKNPTDTTTMKVAFAERPMESTRLENPPNPSEISDSKVVGELDADKACMCVCYQLNKYPPLLAVKVNQLFKGVA